LEKKNKGPQSISDGKEQEAFGQTTEWRRGKNDLGAARSRDDQYTLDVIS
jgi:hypothetical protein